MAKYYSFQLRLQVPEGPEADLLRFFRDQEENPLLPTRRRIMLALSSFWMTESQITLGHSAEEEAEESILVLLQQAQEIAEQAHINLDDIDIPDVVQRIMDKVRAQSKRSPRQTSRKRVQSEQEPDREEAADPPPQQVRSSAAQRTRTPKEIATVADPEPAKSTAGNGAAPLKGERKKLF